MAQNIMVRVPYGTPPKKLWNCIFNNKHIHLMI